MFCCVYKCDDRYININRETRKQHPANKRLLSFVMSLVAPVKVSECDDDDDMIGCCLVMVITAFKSPPPPHRSMIVLYIECIDERDC